MRFRLIFLHYREKLHKIFNKDSTFSVNSTLKNITNNFFTLCVPIRWTSNPRYDEVQGIVANGLIKSREMHGRYWIKQSECTNIATETFSFINKGSNVFSFLFFFTRFPSLRLDHLHTSAMWAVHSTRGRCSQRRDDAFTVRKQSATMVDDATKVRR